ncbi:MAG: glycosyltransferase family 39 protein [Endozoicomonas sp.]
MDNLISRLVSWKVSLRTSSRLQPWHWLTVLCFLQLLFWTLGPWLVRQTLVYDTLESIVWGSLWQWGYDKHPPLTAWLTACIAGTVDDPDLPIYLLAQVCVVVTFWAVWRLAREFLSAHAALTSSFLLLGVTYYSNRVERVTPDTLQSPIWALLVLSFYFAVTESARGRALRFWFFSGILAGLAILTKYQAAVLLICLFVIMISTDKGLQCWRTAGPWLGAITALAIIAPHIHWLMENNFVSVSYLNSNYIDNPEYGQGHLSDHLVVPVNFLGSALANLVPLALIVWPLAKLRNTAPGNDSFQARFLTVVATGPLLLTALCGMITGEELIPRWATPYFAWLPLWLLVMLRIEINESRFLKTAYTCLLTGLILWCLRIGYLYWKPYITDDYWKADEFLPAREEMARAETLWQAHFPSKLHFLGGQHYHVTGLTAYSQGKVIPFLGLDPRQSQWMTEKEFRKEGGIIVIRQGNRETSPVRDRLQNHYPEAEYLGTFSTRPKIPIAIKNPTMSVVEYYLLRPEIWP